MQTGRLHGKVAVVAGATRGAGRGIACALGEEGATVYCTGRSVRGQSAMKGRPESIEETAEMITARGGKAVAVQVDHTRPDQVEDLFARVKRESGGLDILVNDIWGGDELTEFGKTFWTVSLERGLAMMERAVHTHIITSHFGVPLMFGRGRGLIVEITDGDSWSYRGNIFYDLVKRMRKPAGKAGAYTVRGSFRTSTDTRTPMEHGRIGDVSRNRNTERLRDATTDFTRTGGDCWSLRFRIGRSE
jgi:NAD(P)-dependent dehydrogenase (short-subunit alcohol dehydrogenase family)